MQEIKGNRQRKQEMKQSCQTDLKSFTSVSTNVNTSTSVIQLYSNMKVGVDLVGRSLCLYFMGLL